MEKKTNNFNQTFITFKFLDYNKYSYYDYIKLAYPTKLDTIKITADTIRVKVNDYSSFSFPFNFTLSNSVTKRISRQFDFEIYTNRDNMIYLFLNDEFNYYQVELFAQINPPKEVLSLQTKIRVNNKDYLILINCIDTYHSKFVCHLCNFPLNFQFISPEVNFLVDEADIKNHNKYKMCLYYLKKSKFHITCHAIDYELNSTKLSKRIASMNEDKVLEFSRDLKGKVEDKLEQHKDNMLEKNMEDLMKAIENIYKEELLMNDERESIFMTFAEISIKSIKKWNSKLYEIFSNVYYLSLFFAHSNKWRITEEEEESDEEDGDESDNSTENKRIEKIKKTYIKFYEFVTKREELLISIKDDKYENKLLKESLFISSFSLYINSKETQEELYYLPQLVELSDLEENNFYYKAFSFLHKIIDNLNNTSYLVEPLMLLNSNISEDINLLNEDRKEKQFEICIIDINSMKSEIKHFIPTSFYRWYSSSKVRAFYQPRGNILVINEKLLFNKSKRKVDSSFIKGGGLKTIRLTTSVVFLLLHELLGHKKLAAKNFSINSPDKVLFNGQFVSGGEAGEYIERYISSSEKLNFIKSPLYVRPFSIIKDTSLFTQKTNEALNQKIDDLIEENDKAIKEKRKSKTIKSDQKKERNKSHYKFHYLLGDRLFTKMTIGIPQF